jgi:hypothetical protein
MNSNNKGTTLRQTMRKLTQLFVMLTISATIAYADKLCKYEASNFTDAYDCAHNCKTTEAYEDIAYTIAAYVYCKYTGVNTDGCEDDPENPYGDKDIYTRTVEGECVGGSCENAQTVGVDTLHHPAGKRDNSCPSC